MSKISDLLEESIAHVGRSYNTLPNNLPSWMLQLGIQPNAKILSSTRIGAYDKNNKTDVLIRLENSVDIKISAKLSSADYYGNWYGHVRFLEEFGVDAFSKLTLDCTDWANWWITQPQANPFVGVSICFGRRTGNTAKNFLDIFSIQDIIAIVKGYGSEDLDATANCLYISSYAPRTIEELISNLLPINLETIQASVGNFMIAYRPINPMTEGTNRGKNVYTQYVPHAIQPRLITLTTAYDLSRYGCFQTVFPDRINHNHILNNLECKYNIRVPRK